MDYQLFGILVSLHLFIQGVLSVGVALTGPRKVRLGDPFTLECIIPTEDLAKGTEIEYYKIVNNQPELIYQYRIRSSERGYYSPTVKDRVDRTYEPPTSLRVLNSSTQDDGVYRCQMYDYVDLAVLEAETTVHILQVPKGELESNVSEGQVLSVGDEVAVNCTAVRHFPSVEIVWLLDGREFVTSSDVDETDRVVTQRHDDNTNTTWVQRTFTVNENHLGKTLTCRANLQNHGTAFGLNVNLKANTTADVDTEGDDPDNSAVRSAMLNCWLWGSVALATALLARRS